MDRAFFYAVVVGGIYALCMLLLLDNQPIAILSGILVGILALLRGLVVLR
jgi:hypothetical protein